MKSDRSSTQQEQMRKRMRQKKQQYNNDNQIDENITPRKMGPLCSNFPSPSTAPPLKRHIVLHNCGRKVQSAGRTTRHGDGEAAGNEPSSWLNRKFYIVVNNGKPIEVYCTDLIHRVKQCSQRQRLGVGDGQRFLRVVDRWREEWNHGVQMPLGTGTDTFLAEPTNLFAGLARTKNFQLPSKLVAMDTSVNNRYIDEKHFHFAAKPPTLYYNLDEEDILWLKKRPTAVGADRCRGRTSSIAPRTFVDVMNCFELLTYKKMHDALLEPTKKASKNSEEDDVECCICRWPLWETGDQIVFCDGCNIAVHQVCYGIAEVPHGQWFCQLCTQCGPSTPKECLFCPVRGGAMKATKNFESWAHVVCALFIIEVRFGDAEQREPITHVNEVPAEKWRARCCVCDTRSGACIKCTHPKCDETFHVSCAQFANFVLDIENDDRELNGVKYVSLCGKHSSRSQHQRSRNFRFNKNRLSEMQQNFEQYVDVKVIAAHLGVSAQIVGQIYNYWVSKRNKNGKRPLIVEPEDSRSVALGTAIPVVVQRQDKRGEVQRKNANCNSDNSRGERKQGHSNDAETEQYRQMPRRKLVAKFDKIRQLRIHSEKARNLCYMVAKREKLKKQCMEQFELQVKLTASNVFGRVPPVSARCMERILSEWREAADFKPTAAAVEEEEEEDNTNTTRGRKRK
ncbi:hypothetical protein niasHS_001547 [Heterodera schachtii]|uniref:Uncharacterized protein n=1 Tax=Heterodera schachtii TaxID=97005 RepID=A0ABD2KDS7_HETSC